MRLINNRKLIIIILLTLFLFTACTSGKKTENKDDLLKNINTTADIVPENIVLMEVFKNNFKVGVAVSESDIRNNARTALIKKHFNSITSGNNMKPEKVLDRQASLQETAVLSPAITGINMKQTFEYAKQNDIALRFHTLVWHQQTPFWFFKENYETDFESPFVSREVMLIRLENYIKKVFEYIETNYPNVIYAVDVVNEAIEPANISSDNPNAIRKNNNPWYETIGADYAEYAFLYARKYAPPYVKLFYNDYNCWEKNKIPHILSLINRLQEKNLIDGIGMQGHLRIDYPNLLNYKNAITVYGETGLEIHITELDINNRDNTEYGQTKLAEHYKQLMTIVKSLDDQKTANITNITLWGLTDNTSWLNYSIIPPTTTKGPNYPLLFDAALNPKAAFYAFALTGNK